MAATPKNPFSELPQSQRLGVFIASAPDQKPTQSDEKPWISCEEIHHGCGSSLAFAKFRVDLAALGARIQDVHLKENMNRQVEVWTMKTKADKNDETNDLRDKSLFWGEFVDLGVPLAAGGGTLLESRIVTARVLPYHVSEVVEGQRVYDYAGEMTVDVGFDLHFNPQIDGRIIDNMIEADDEKNPEDYPIWIDPESSRSSTAISEFHGTPEEWTLSKAVTTLCNLANSEESFIVNPFSGMVEKIFSDPPPMRNVMMKRGFRLSEYLSSLLPPQGYNWFVNARDFGFEKPIIEVYERGHGTEKEIPLQAFGSDLDVTKTSLVDFSVEYGIGAVTNKVKVNGAFKEREVTLPLYRGWGTEDDGNEEHDDINEPVGRLLIANEGGDYKDLRPEIGDPPDIFDTGSVVPKHRRIYDCLTYQDKYDSTLRRRVFVEFRESPSGEWKDIAKIGQSDGNSSFNEYVVLPTKIGIWITARSDDGNAIPSLFLDTETEFRITGTVRDDYRITFETDPDDESPNSNVITRHIDASHRFYDRQRVTEGDFASRFHDDPNYELHDERDDSDEIEEYALKVLEIEKAAQVHANLKLRGISTAYKISDVITKIAGRNISFNRLSNESRERRYLQVIGIRYINNPGGQYTQLETEAFDMEHER